MVSKKRQVAIDDMLRTNAEFRAEERARRKALLDCIEKERFKTVHLRLDYYGCGCVTLLYRLVNAHTYQVKYGFCSPRDCFCKKDGRIEALRNQLFTLYRPEDYPVVYMALDFLAYVTKNSRLTEENNDAFEEKFEFPRWLEKFLVVFSERTELIGVMNKFKQVDESEGVEDEVRVLDVMLGEGNLSNLATPIAIIEV